MEDRISRLERQLGLINEGPTTSSSSHDDGSVVTTSGTKASLVSHSADLSTRLDALQRQSTSMISATEWKELDELLNELAPGTALTHQKQIMAPILYRRAEILADATSFQSDMQQVSNILKLLLVSESATSKTSPPMLSTASKGITEQQVLQAPILVQSQLAEPSTVEVDAQLESLSTTIVNLQGRIQEASTKLDGMLYQYSNVVAAVSEKLVLADEAIRMKEKEKGLALKWS